MHRLLRDIFIKLQNLNLAWIFSFFLSSLLGAQTVNKFQIRTLNSNKQIEHPHLIWGQTIYKCHIQPIHTLNQIQKVDSNYLEIRKADLKDKYMSVKLKNKKKLILATDTIIGFKIKEDSSYVRIQKGEFYTVFQVNDLVLYYKKINQGKFVDTYYYFSYDLNSEIYWINEKTIVPLFNKNICFLKKLSTLSLLGSPSEWDKKNETLKFMVWYNECK